MNLYKDLVHPHRQSTFPNPQLIHTSQPQQILHQTSSINHPIPHHKNDKTKTFKNSKQFKNDFKKVFIVYSRLHCIYKLKHQTLFLASQLYRQYCIKQAEKNIPEGYLQAICLYLAMKYQEIYPPRFKNILPYICNTIDQSQYNKYQFMFLKATGIDMDIITGKKIIDSLLQKHSKEVYFYAYYLLQLCYSANIIDQPYTLHEIASSIIYSMSPYNQPLKNIQRFNEISIQTIVDCTKMIIVLKSKACQNQSLIYKKYNQPRYEAAAIKSPTIQTSKVK